ncbi:MAG: prenyltransferase [bacterium]
MPDIRPYAGIARAPFLLLPVALVAAGAGAARYGGSFDILRTLIALVGLLSLHIAVNALNEASDMVTGIDLETDRTPFSGGSGTLPSGALSVGTARRFAYLAAGVGLGCGIYFLIVVGPIMLPLMAAGALLVLFYTDMLARTALGEAAAGLGLGMLPVVGSALVQDGSVPPAAWIASVPAFLMTFDLLLLNEFPDEEADRKGGRRNLVLLLGRPAAARVYAAAGLLVPAWIGAAVAAGWLPPPVLAALLPSLALVGPVRWAFGAPEEAVPIPALGSNVIWNLATNLVLGLTLFLAA